MINTSFVKMLLLVMVLVGLPHVCFGETAWSDDPAFSGLTLPPDFSSRASIAVSEQSEKNVYQCARKCVVNANCSSFFYHTASNRCTPLQSQFTRKDHLVPSNGMEYWRIKDVIRCPIDKCFYRMRAAQGGLCLALYPTTTEVSYSQSVDICTDNGGDNATLAKIATRAELDALMEFMRYNMDDYNSYFHPYHGIKMFPYLGAQRSSNTTPEYQFEWADGTPMPMKEDPDSLWSSGEPSKTAGMGEDCVLVKGNGWHDYPCETDSEYGAPNVVLCQYNL